MTGNHAEAGGLTTNEEMLYRMVQKEEGAWTEFDARYRRICMGWLRAMRYPEVIWDDVYQNFQLCLFASIDRFERRGPGAFRAWMKTLIHRRAVEHVRWLRKHGPRDENDKPIDSFDTDSSSPDKNVLMDRVWMNEFFVRAFNSTKPRMSQDVWESVRRCVLNDEKVEVVAQERGISRGIIYTHKDRFLQRLREEFTKLLVAGNEVGVNVCDKQIRQELKYSLDYFLAERKNDIGTEGLPDDMIESFAKTHIDRLTHILREDRPRGVGMSIRLLVNGFEWKKLKPTVLGSSEDALTHIDDSSVSAQHAQIDRDEDGQWFIEDLRSRNCTIVNGNEIKDRQPLMSGDWIQLGKAFLVVFDANEGIGDG